MPSRRGLIQNFYKGRAPGQVGQPIQKAAASDRFDFVGEAVEATVVVRSDLNGYSAWARERPVADRVRLLDEFFSSVVTALESKGGIYFRDEGDCIVGLFSDYFKTGATFAKVEEFGKAVAQTAFGAPKLSAKTTIAYGPVAYFQKAHELGTADWSAEGDPFVRCARLEQAVESKPRIYWYADEYDRHFMATSPIAAKGTKFFWRVNRESLQVPGLALAGGWTEIFSLEHVPGGQLQE